MLNTNKLKPKTKTQLKIVYDWMKPIFGKFTWNTKIRASGPNK